MRLVTFELATPLGPASRVGALTPDDAVLDLTLACAVQLPTASPDRALAIAGALVPPDMQAFLEGGEATLEAARAAQEHAGREGVDDWRGRTVLHAPGSVRLRAPLPRPRSLRDFMVAEEHVRNSMKGRVPDEWYNLPIYYKANMDAILGPGDTVPWPRYTEKLDYELELVCVIGRGGRHLAAEDAEAHIAGYTIYNDWSARDIQFREMSVGLGPAYGKDFATSLGPAIATPDEFGPARPLAGARMSARVDGEVWSEGSLGPMRFSFAEIIDWLSEEQPLHPGELLGSGTVGRGCGLELDRWIAPGSQIELTVEGIGTLDNRVGERSAEALGRWAPKSPPAAP